MDIWDSAVSSEPYMHIVPFPQMNTHYYWTSLMTINPKVLKNYGTKTYGVITGQEVNGNQEKNGSNTILINQKMKKITKTKTDSGLLYEGKEIMILQKPGSLWDTEGWLFNTLKPFEDKKIKLTITVDVEELS